MIIPLHEKLLKEDMVKEVELERSKHYIEAFFNALENRNELLVVY